MNVNALSRKQVEVLLRPINPNRVQADPKGFAYVSQHDIRAHLTRIFGFGEWSADLQSLDCIVDVETMTKGSEKKPPSPAWYVVYRAVMRLTIHATGATFTEAHVGSSTHPDRGEAHGNAVTNSESYALKRCAINLGDQFGLGLYEKGSRAAIVKATLAMPTPELEDGPVLLPEPESVAPEVDEKPAPAEDRSESTPVEPAAVAPSVSADALAVRAQALADDPSLSGKARQVAFIKLNLEAVTARLADSVVQVEGMAGPAPLGEWIAWCAEPKEVPA